MLAVILRNRVWEEAGGLKSRVYDRKLRLFACGCVRQVGDRLTEEVMCPHCGRHSQLDGCHLCGGTGSINRSRRAVEVAERYADGEATVEELGDDYAVANAHFRDACANPHRPGSTFELELAYKCCGEIRDLTNNSGLPRWFSVSTKLAATQAALLRCLFGNPWRPGPQCRCRSDFAPHDFVGCPLSAWTPDTVMQLAGSIYDTRDWAALPVLADALEEAGCPADVPCAWCRGTRCTGWRGNLQTGSADPVCAGCDSRGTLPHPLLAHLRSPGPHARGCHALDLVLGKE